MHISTRRPAFAAAILLLTVAAIFPILTADASATTTMVELTRISVPGTGSVRGAAASPDETRVYVGRGQTVYEIDTLTNTVVSTLTLLLPNSAAFILDLAVSSDGQQVFVITHVSTASTQIDSLTTSGGLSHDATFTHGVGGQRVDVPKGDSVHFVVTGQFGWIQVRQDNLAIVTDVFRPEQVKGGTVSHDGTRVYGQRQNTVSSDRAFGFTMAGAPLGGFTFGDAGGGMHYTSVDSNPNNDRVLLFAGDAALGQNSWVLDRDANLLQTLNIQGISEGTEGVDGETVIVTQNQGTSSSQNSGLSIIKLIKDTGTGWSQGQKLILDDFGTRFAGDIATTASLRRYYVNNLNAGEVIVVGDGTQNSNPDCSAAAPSVSEIWPPNHIMRDVSVLGVTDPDSDPVSINIDGIMQDEAVDGAGDGNTAPDGAGVGTSTASVRAERSGLGDGRIYEISFTASDPTGGSCSGTVIVTVPKDQGAQGAAVNSGAVFDSTASP